MKLLTIYLIAYLAPTSARMLPMEGNQLLFTTIGETARESGYAHLVIPIPTPNLARTLDTLKDLTKAHQDAVLTEEHLFRRTEQYGLILIQDKINLILSLAQKGGFVSKELVLDDQNLIQEGLDALSERRERDVATAASALLGLASFGTSIFNVAQINRLRADMDRHDAQHRFIMDEVDEAHLRINNVTRFVKQQYQAWVEQVAALEAGNKRTIMKEMDHQIHLMIQAFRMELTDFLSGITLLMENRLSPLLIKSDALIKGFGKLVRLARARNMRPISGDAGILFQVSTSTFVNKKGKLHAIVHLPLYAGDSLTLYKYVPAPFYLENATYVMEVTSREEYLALDTHGTVGKLLTTSEFQLCRHVGSIFHCPNMNLLNKELHTLCLYNLYNQDPKRIEETCTVTISKAGSHAVQISNSLYRILAAKPVQLVQECRTGTNITTIRGVHLLQLTEDCPKASTPHHLFIRTPDLLVGLQKIITLPLLSQSRQWLGDVAKELDLKRAFRGIEELTDTRAKVPLSKVREHLANREYSVYKEVEGYIVTFVAYAVILYVTGKGLWFVFQHPRFRVRRFRGGRQLTAVRYPPRASDLSDSDGPPNNQPNVDLPLQVRRQFAY